MVESSNAAATSVLSPNAPAPLPVTPPKKTAEPPPPVASASPAPTAAPVSGAGTATPAPDTSAAPTPPPPPPPEEAPPDSPEIYKSYKLGDTTLTGDTIAEILFFGRHFIIFLNPAGDFDCEWDERACQSGDLSMGQAGALYARLQDLGPAPAVTTRGVNFIANGLSDALENRTPDDTRDYFHEAEEYVGTKIREHQQTVYLLTAAVLTLYLLIGMSVTELLGLPGFLAPYAFAAGFGGLGGFLSVLQRFRDTPIPRYASRGALASEGLVRIGIAAILGIVFLLLQRAEFLLGKVANTEPALAVFCLIAGLNERFVPGLLDRVAETATRDEGDKTGHSGDTATPT